MKRIPLPVKLYVAFIVVLALYGMLKWSNILPHREPGEWPHWAISWEISE